MVEAVQFTTNKGKKVSFLISGKRNKLKRTKRSRAVSKNQKGGCVGSVLRNKKKVYSGGNIFKKAFNTVKNGTKSIFKDGTVLEKMREGAIEGINNVRT